MTRNLMRPLSIGVEEEFLLVDTETLTLAPRSDAVVAHARDAGLTTVVGELTRFQVEANLPPVRELRSLHECVSTTRRTVSAIALAQGSHLLAAGLSPTAVPRLGRAAISDQARYHALAERFGALAYSDASCGAHVHIEIPDTGTAVEVSNRLRPWLPTLLAATANSAVYDGVDTGHASWRSVLWGRWPTAGPPPFLRSVQHYRDLVAASIERGEVMDEAALYWDVRPSTHQPTLEVRVSDVPATVHDTVLLAALIRGLVQTALDAYDAGHPPPEPPDHCLVAAYHAARANGLTGDGIDPFTGARVPARRLLGRLVDHLRTALIQSSDLHHVVALLERLDHRGNGAHRQHATYAARTAPDAVMRAAIRDTVSDGPVLGERSRADTTIQ